MDTNNTRTVSIKVPRQEFDEMNKLLKENPDIIELNLSPDTTIFSYRGTFENDYEAIVEVFTGNSSVMASAYLYDSEGNDIDYIVSDEGLSDTYTFMINDCEYVVILDFIQNNTESESIPMNYLPLSSNTIDLHTGGTIRLEMALIHQDGRRFVVTHENYDVKLRQLYPTDNDWYFIIGNVGYFFNEFGLKFSFL